MSTPKGDIARPPASKRVRVDLDVAPSQVEKRLADLGESVVRHCSRLHDSSEADLDERISLGGELHEAWTLLGGNHRAFHRWLEGSGWKFSQVTAWYHRMLAEHEDDVRRVFKTWVMDTPPNYKTVVNIIRKTPENVEAICAGDMTIAEAVRRAKASQAHRRVQTDPANLVQLGKYDVILADPPWKFDNDQPSRSVERYYPTMSVDDIKALKIPTADRSVLLLWVPNALLPVGLDVMDAWGFEYRSNFTWVKGSAGMGYWVRSQHELLLIGAQGGMPPPEPEHRHPSVVSAPTGPHSKKPDVFYEMIERMYPEARRLEMFAREPRRGWDSWGDQLPSTEGATSDAVAAT